MMEIETSRTKADEVEPPKHKIFGQFIEPFLLSRPFPYLWLGQLISFLGSSVTMVILPVIVYSITGSTTTMGFIMAAYMLPNIIMLPISGWIVDRYNRIHVMLTTDLLRFVIISVLAGLLFTGSLSVHVLFVIVALYGAMDGLFQPAYAAVRAVVFTPEIRNSANAITQISNQAVRLIGPSLGGILVTFMSAGWGISLDALTYIASFACLVLLRKLIPFQRTQTAKSSGVGNDFTEGFAVLKGNAWLWITIVVFSLVNICYSGLVTVLLPWLFKIHLEMSPYVYGVAVTCSGAGAIIAGLVFGMKKQWHRRGMFAYGGAIASGIALLLMSVTPNAVGLCALFALEGFGIMIFGLIWETTMQELVPQEAFGRVASLDMLGSFALLPVGFVVIGWLADVIGGTQTIALFASIGILSLVCALLVPAIRRFD